MLKSRQDKLDGNFESILQSLKKSYADKIDSLGSFAQIDFLIKKDLALKQAYEEKQANANELNKVADELRTLSGYELNMQKYLEAIASKVV